MNDMVQTETALTVIAPSAVSTIVANGGGDILSKIAAKVAEFVPDVSTPTGRDAMRSLAAEIAKSKMDLIRLGKSLTEEWRASTKAVNAECNLVEERMDDLRDRVRQPLTEFEVAEKDRVQGHQDAIAIMLELASASDADSAIGLIDARLERLRQVYARHWDIDFKTKAGDVFLGSQGQLNQQRERSVRLAFEAAELARLRAADAARQAEEAERQRVEREAGIAAEARIEAERVAADAVKAAQERAAQTERDRQTEAARAETARLKAIQDAEIAQTKALADAEAARVAEAKRLAAEDQARAADRDHRGKIMGAAKDALMAHAELTEVHAKAAVKAIVGGLVPAVSVRF